MTLVIAWKTDGKIQIISDSRISFEAGSKVDYGVKISQVPVILDSVVDGLTNQSKHVFIRNYGYAFAGSSLHAYLTKEHISNFLQNLQPSGPIEDVTFEGICNAACIFANTISGKLTTILGKRGEIEFLLVGCCPKEQQVKAARFYFDKQDLCLKFEGVLDQNNSHVFLGDGASAISNYSTLIDTASYIKAMKLIIDDESVDTVGGDIQIGATVSNDFVLYGYLSHTEENGRAIVTHNVRGFDLNELYTQVHEFGLHIKYPLLVNDDFSSPPKLNAQTVYQFSL